MIVSEDLLDKAVHHLSETDGEAARLYGLYEGLKDQLKTVYGMAYSKTSGAQEQRKAESYTDPEYIRQLEKINIARVEYETLRLQRKTQELIVEVWRTESANTRAGAIT